METRVKVSPLADPPQLSSLIEEIDLEHKSSVLSGCLPTPSLNTLPPQAFK